MNRDRQGYYQGVIKPLRQTYVLALLREASELTSILRLDTEPDLPFLQQLVDQGNLREEAGTAPTNVKRFVITAQGLMTLRNTPRPVVQSL